MQIIQLFYQRFFVCLLCIFLTACELDKSIVDENYLKRQESSNSQGSLDDGIWFKNMAVGTNFFAAKPNEETELMVMQGALFTRSDDTELTAAQLKRVNFSLTGANKDLFSLVKKTFTKENAHNFPAGEQTVLVFNKGMVFFFDEVKKRCRICNVTLKADLDNGTQAIARISLKLLEVDSFALTSVLAIDAEDKQARFTLNLNALAKEGELNHLYLLSSNLVQGKGVPNASLFKGLEYDTNHDGEVDPSESLNAAHKAFWKEAIPTAKMLKQAKYDLFSTGIETDTGVDYAADLARFKVVFYSNSAWLDSIKQLDLVNNGLGVNDKFYARIDEIKVKQGNQSLPVVTFNAPILAEDQRILRTCSANGKNLFYYISDRPYKVNMTVIATDKDASWLKIQISVYIIGSDDENYSILDHYVNEKFGLDYYRVCLANEEKVLHPTPLPSIELLPPLTNGTD